MARIVPIVPDGENEPVKLRVAPKICKSCGGKYIPTSNRQVYCQECRKAIGKQKTGGKTKMERDLEHAFGTKEETRPFEPVTVTVTPEEIAEEMADKVTIAKEPADRQQIVKGLASLLSESLGVEVLPFDAVEDLEIYVGKNRIFHGYAIGRASK